MGESGVGQGVADVASFGGGGDEPAPAQAGQVVRDIRPGQVQRLCQLGWIPRSVEQGQQDPAPGRIGHRPTDPSQRIQARRRGQHASYCTVIAVLSKNPAAELIKGSDRLSDSKSSTARARERGRLERRAVLFVGLVLNAVLGWWWADPAVGRVVAARQGGQQAEIKLTKASKAIARLVRS